METPPSDSRQPPDGHEFPEHEEIQFKKVSVNVNLINDKFLSARREDSPQSNRYFIQSTSNTDLRPKMYESTEDLKYDDFLPEPSPLYTRSQSLTDVSSLAKKNTKWNQMYEQRRKGLSKLKGLVIPEAAESDVSPSVNLPEIKSQTPTMYIPVPKFDNFSSTETILTSDADLLRTSIVIPSWSPSTPSNLPKYSPAFKRKSLQVYPTSISKSESDYSTTLDFPIKYCDKVSPKGNKINDDDLNPPKSLESISSPTRSDCSFDYISSSKKYSKSNGDTFQKQGGRIEDESDNDSAVSSSQSSYNSRYSPPSSPTRSCELNHYSKKIEEDERTAQNRLLKPSSVEATNRRNILASAKCRSGKDLKIGSPVIRRKQEESQQEPENYRLKREEDEFRLSEPVYHKPPIDAIDLIVTKEKPEEVIEVKISENKTTREYVRQPKEQVDKRNNETPTKVATTNIFLALNSSSLNPVQKKLPEEMKEIKPKDYLSTNSNSRKPGPINVKALKKNFENMNSPPPLPQKVPVFKSPEPRNYNKVHEVVTDSKPMMSFRNGLDRSIEKLDILPPKFPEKKSSDVDTKTVVLKTDPYGTSLGITLSGGIDESKDITVHRIKYSSIAYTDGRLKKGDKILSINGKSTSDLSHAKAVELLQEPVNEFHIVIEEGGNIVPSPINTNGSLLQRRSSSMSSVLSRTKSPSLEVIEERKANNVVSLVKDGAGLGFSIEGGRDSPQGNVPLLVKKIFTGGAAEKCSQLKVGDEIIQINDIKFTLLTRIEAWNAMKKIPDGKVEIHIFR